MDVHHERLLGRWRGASNPRPMGSRALRDREQDQPDVPRGHEPDSRVRVRHVVVRRGGWRAASGRVGQPDALGAQPLLDGLQRDQRGVLEPVDLRGRLLRLHVRRHLLQSQQLQQLGARRRVLHRHDRPTVHRPVNPPHRALRLQRRPRLLRVRAHRAGRWHHSDGVGGREPQLQPHLLPRLVLGRRRVLVL